MDIQQFLGVYSGVLANTPWMDTPKMALTDTAIRQKARPQANAFKLADSGGLFLYVTPVGSRLWRWKYRHGGKERLMSFGAYPDVSLAQARELHRQGRAVLATGTDPMAERKAEKQTDAVTFKAVAEKWHQHWKPGKTAKHAKDVWRRLELDILPTLGSASASDLTAAQVREALPHNRGMAFTRPG